MADFSLFNETWYLQQNPDVAAAVAAGAFTAQEHFALFGKIEGRSPGPLFDVQHYLLANTDVAQAVADGLLNAYDHFTLFGASESRAPIEAFDVSFYLTQNPDVAAAVALGQLTAVEHFLQFGRGEPRNVMLGIDLAAYLEANADLNAAFQAGLLSPLDHLLNHGLSEARNLGNGVNLALFQDDPIFQTAIASGDFDGALERVSDVAPFLPGFVRPPGWIPTADMLIPLDFVPTPGTKLVIPPDVLVPDNVTLPDTFEPPLGPPVNPPDPPDPPNPPGPPDPPPDPDPDPPTLVIDSAETFTAAELNNQVVTGTGSVTITASDGNQRLEIGTNGPNVITAGKGADTIVLNSTGADTLVIGGGETPVKEVHRFELDAGYLQANGHYQVTLWDEGGETIQTGPLAGNSAESLMNDLVAQLNADESLVSFKRISDTAFEAAFRIRHGDVQQQSTISKTNANGENPADIQTSSTTVNHDPGSISDSAFWYLDAPTNTQAAVDVIVGFNSSTDKIELPYGSTVHDDSGVIAPDTDGFDHQGLQVASITNGIATFQGREGATAADKTTLLLDVLKADTHAVAFIAKNSLGQESTYIVQGDRMQGDTIADVYILLANTVITDLGMIIV